MVVALHFPDLKDFNLYCQLLGAKKGEIIQVFHERGGIILVIDRDASETGNWEEKRKQFFSELKGQ